MLIRNYLRNPAPLPSIREVTNTGYHCRPSGYSPYLALQPIPARCCHGSVVNRGVSSRSNTLPLFRLLYLFDWVQHHHRQTSSPVLLFPFDAPNTGVFIAHPVII